MVIIGALLCHMNMFNTHTHIYNAIVGYEAMASQAIEKQENETHKHTSGYISRKHIDMLFTKGFMCFSCDAYISQPLAVFDNLFYELSNRIEHFLGKSNYRLKPNAIKVHVQKLIFGFYFVCTRFTTGVTFGGFVFLRHSSCAFSKGKQNVSMLFVFFLFGDSHQNQKKQRTQRMGKSFGAKNKNKKKPECFA